MMRHLKALIGAQDGTATIELAIVAPVLALAVAGIGDISVAYGRELELEQAAQRAIEKVGQTTGESTAAATIQKEAVCQINGANSDGTCKSGRISTSNVTVTYSLTCDGTTVSYSSDCATGQTEVRYIQATVTDKYTPFFPKQFGTESDGTYHLTATAGVRVQ